MCVDLLRSQMHSMLLACCDLLEVIDGVYYDSIKILSVENSCRFPTHFVINNCLIRILLMNRSRPISC